MAFLDNSGDIILDAVLTDTGRWRLAKGDGSFKIAKFALADDEINYGLYNKNHASGSAYYDLEILQTPSLEAFTNNTSTMNYKLLSISRTNLLYLPILKINNVSIKDHSGTNSQNNGYAVAVTKETWGETRTESMTADEKDANNGIWCGEAYNSTAHIRLDQGIDNNAISWKNDIDLDLKETQYIIEIDSRLGSIANPDTDDSQPEVSFIDDDNIASYYISQDPALPYVTAINGNTERDWKTQTDKPGELILAGPMGTALRFRI